MRLAPDIASDESHRRLMKAQQRAAPSVKVEIKAPVSTSQKLQRMVIRDPRHWSALNAKSPRLSLCGL